MSISVLSRVLLNQNQAQASRPTRFGRDSLALKQTKALPDPERQKLRRRRVKRRGWPTPAKAMGGTDPTTARDGG